MSKLRPFHLAIPVHDMQKARAFYGKTLGFSEGRSTDLWIDWNFYGHQVVTILNPEMTPEVYLNPVDGKSVPVPHFGVVLTMSDWEALSSKVQKTGVPFIIEPYIRFKGLPGEQATMFFQDPSGNALEFKAFKNLDALFEKQ